jgi:hypothetical protein
LISSTVNSKQKKQKQKNLLVLDTVYHLTKFVIFGHFFGNGDNIGDRQFLGDLFSYSKRVILLLPEMQVSYGVLGNFFFTNWPCSQKTRGASGITPFLLLEKLSYIMKIITPPKNQFLYQFASFFVSSLSPNSK